MPVHAATWWDDIARDVRYGCRAMWRHGGVSAAVITTLAFGIGAVVTLFAVVDAVILRPLPYRDPGRLAIAWTVDSKSTAATGDTPVSLPDLEDWRAHAGFAGLAGFRSLRTFVQAPAGDLTIELVESSPEFLPLLGVPAALGRIWRAEESRGGGLRPAVISHALWQDLFAADAAAIGRAITITQNRYEVVGVMPRGFRTPAVAGPTEIGLTPAYTVWSPFVPRPVHNLRGNRGLRVLARVPDGASISHAESALVRLSGQLAATYADTNAGKGARLTPLIEAIAGRSRPALQGLLAAGSLLLLIAWTNATGLVLVRIAARHREWIARISLGASRRQLMTQVLIECGLLSLAGTALGVGLAAFLLETGRAVFAGSDLPRLAEAGLAGRALTLGIVLGLISASIVGLVPGCLLTLAGPRIEPPGAHSRSDARMARLGRALAATQVGLALTLTISAFLLILSVSRLIQSHGLEAPDRTIAFHTSTAGTRWAATTANRQLYASLRERLTAIPGVEAVGFTSQILSLGDRSSSDVVVEGAPPLALDDRPLAVYTLADPDFLRMSGVVLREGRIFAEDDAPDGPRAAVVNQAFVAAAGISGSAVGRRVHLSALGTDPFHIGGVVSDSRAGALGTSDGPRLYYSGRQSPASRFVVLVQWRGDLPDADPMIRGAVHEVDPRLPILELQTLAQAVERGASQSWRGSVVVACFTTFALFLAAVGVYGLVSFIVSARRKECGIRLALGATRWNVCGVMAMHGIRAVAAGLALGALGGLGTDTLLAHYGFLYLTGTDRTAVTGAAALLVLVVTAAASLWPAARGMRFAPLPLLRND